MKNTRKAKIPVKSIRKYKEGYFVEPNQYAWGGSTASATSGISGSSINSIGQLGASAVNSAQPNNGDTSAGLSAASGALSGAGEGAMIGSIIPGVGTVIGGAVGAVVGGTIGLISGGKKHAAYERQQLQNTSNSYFNQRGNMQSQNVDPYGSQMALGDEVPRSKKPITPNLNQYYNFPNNNSPYWKTNPLMTEHPDGSFRAWGEKPNPYIPPTQFNPTNPNNVLPTDKALGQSNIFYPSNTQPTLQSPPTIHSNNYANGASVGLSGRASGKFYVPNAGLRRFAPHMARVGRPNPLPSNNINFNTTSQDSPQNMATGDRVLGNNPDNYDDSQGTPINSQENQINIQKGELLIHPDSGKILQEYNGINPLTGGMFEPHAKSQDKESPNNFTLADPGLFVITKKTAKQYKDAVDNNDKISQKTVLMNIRNSKIQKEGGLQPQGNYAYGDEIAMPNNPAMPSNNSNIQYDGNFQPMDSRIQSYQYSMPSVQSPQGASNPSTMSKIGDAVTNYGPAAFNIAQGLFGNAQHQAYATPTVNPYASNVIANMPKNVNMQPVINDIYDNEEAANKNIQSQTNNSAVYRANRQALAAGSTKALASARMQASEVNNQAAGQRAYMYNALGYQNQQEQDRVRDTNLSIDQTNMRTQAAKQNLLNAGLSQLQQTSQNEKLNNQKAGMDKYSLELLSQTFPNTRFYNQFQIDYVNKLLGRN